MQTSKFMLISMQVYSEAQKRWIHIDPSDDVIDAPLMYQHGWKRKIDYIIAYSNEDIQDVTWRYTNKHAEIKRNRNNCTEPELLKTILLLRGKRQKDLSTARKRFLTKRTLGEVIQSMVERDPTDDELKGRTSGSLSWRAARGEKQTNNVNIPILKPFFGFKIIGCSNEAFLHCFPFPYFVVLYFQRNGG